MNIVVTGANGFIGRYTVNQLLKEGSHVKAIDLVRTNLERHAHLVFYSRDITKDDLTEIIEPGDKVLHLAAIAKFADAEADWQKALTVNVIGTTRVVQACKQAERLVFSSTGAVYGARVPMFIEEDEEQEPTNIYGLSKKCAEEVIRLSNIPYVILRYGYVYGAGKNYGAIGSFIDKIQKGERPIVYGGSQINDFTYVKDIVSANIAALNTTVLYESFNIGTGVGISILETLQTVIHCLNKDIQPDIQPLRKSIDAPIFVYSTEKTKSLLHWEAAYDILEGIRDMLKEMKT
jgi:UDP-glucose 4-epimerase